MQFEIGKTYETTISNFYRSCGLVDVGQRFTCHRIDGRGMLGLQMCSSVGSRRVATGGVSRPPWSCP